MQISKNLSILPEEYKHFRSAWNSIEKKRENTNKFSNKTSMKNQMLKVNEESVAFKTQL